MFQQFDMMVQNFWAALQAQPDILPHLWLYVSLSLLVMLEGPVSILVAAGAAASGYLNPVPVMVAATFGNLIADSAWYCLGYYGKIDWVLRRRKLFGMDVTKIDALKRIIDRYAERILIFSKMTTGIEIPVLISTGVARISWRRWVPIVLVSNTVISLVWVFVGFTMASRINQIESGMRYVVFAVSVVAIVVAVTFLRRWLSRTDLIADLDEKQD